MRYFSIEKCPTEDSSLCMLDGATDGTGGLRHRMTRGLPMGRDIPIGATWSMPDRFEGIKVPTLISCVTNLLVLHRTAAEVFRDTGVPVEILPFTLFNHKKRAASTDHVIVNPLGTLDCLDIEKSDIEWLDDKVGGEVIHVYGHVLDPKKIAGAPPVFRTKEDPYCIVVNEAVAGELRALNPTNVYLTELEVAT
jgi:hypothetical protein